MASNELSADISFEDDQELYKKYMTRTNHHKGQGARAYNYREFISFDGEGTTVNEPLMHPDGIHYVGLEHYQPNPQPYVLLGNSKGERITNKDGLPTINCFEFLLESKVRHPDSNFVGFFFNYDVNQILRDIPERLLKVLHKKGRILCNGYWIKWIPRKQFSIKHRPTNRSMTIYDTGGFFQKAFIDICEAYLGEDDPRLVLIRKGKAARETFDWEQLEEFIIPYNDMEMEMHVEIMNMLREDLHSVDAVPSRWHGPGAVANKVFRNFNIPINREVPKEVLDASQIAYAGGRFELLQMGRHPNTVYQYDIHSAYPAAATQLPDLSEGTWEITTSFEPFSFGLWHIEYDNYRDNWYEDNKPQPLFCRSRNGSISYPNKVNGWYWTPEARLVPDRYVREGYVFRPTTDHRPFAFIKGMYDQRRVFILQENSTERAIKLILNSIYGKMAQTVGGDENTIPTWHQLEYAGYITSYTRAKIYEAILLNPNAIIASETDAVFSTEPLDLPLTKELGDWKEEIYQEICYIQSGFYYIITEDGQIKCKYRGMDKDRNTGQPIGLPYEKVLERLALNRNSLTSKTTRFVGLAAGLQTTSTWRSWETKDHVTYLSKSKRGKSHLHQKRVHDPETCQHCNVDLTLYDRLHPLDIGGHEGISYPSYLPWRDVTISPEYSEYIEKEDMSRWE